MLRLFFEVYGLRSGLDDAIIDQGTPARARTSNSSRPPLCPARPSIGWVPIIATTVLSPAIDEDARFFGAFLVQAGARSRSERAKRLPGSSCGPFPSGIAGLGVVVRRQLCYTAKHVHPRRLGNLIKSNLNSVVDKLSDPKRKKSTLFVEEMEDELKQHASLYATSLSKKASRKSR